MAHTAVLHIDGGSKDGYALIECYYEFNQPARGNQPFGFPTGALIHFVFESFGSEKSRIFYEWMSKPTERLNGKIEFTVLQNEKKTLIFSDAFCIRMHEHFSGQSNAQMFTKMTINANVISFDGVAFKNSEH